MPAHGDYGHSVLAWRITTGSADPSALRDYVVIVNGAWALLGFACFCAMVPLSFLVQLTVGNSALAWIISDRYRELRLRALPSNRSIGLQLAIGVLAAIITGVQW